MKSSYFIVQKSFLRLILISLFLSLAFFSAGYAQGENNNETAKAVDLFNQGQDAHEKSDYKTAVELYRKALEILPEFPEAEYQLGVALQMLGQTEEAAGAFRRALELREDWTLPMVGLGLILVQEGRFEQAEKLLERALELEELNPPALVAVVDLRLKTNASQEELRKLLSRIQVLTSKARPTASLWAARASLERALGDLPAAKQSVSRALALAPTNQSALAEKAEIEIAGNDYQSALETAQTLQKLAPGSIGAGFLLARALVANGRTGEALKILDEIKNPTAEIRQFRTKVIENTKADVSELEKKLENDPKNLIVLGRLCSLLRTANPLSAVQYCRRAMEADPHNLEFVIGFGAALVQARQFEAAVDLFRKVIEIAPDNYTARANLGVALFQLKRFSEAKTQYLWLAEKQPDLAITYYFLGIIYDQLREYANAWANYQQFLRLAEAETNKLEIEKVNLRLPVLQRQMKNKN